MRLVPPGAYLTATDRVIRHGGDAFTWSDVYVTDPNVFDVFTHEILYGDPKTALVDPSSVAGSCTFARKYFGDANPLGETITLDNGEQLTITLVFADLPPNTHLKHDVLLSYSRLPPVQDETERAMALFGSNHFTFLVLPEHYDVRRFEPVAKAFYERHMAARAGSCTPTPGPRGSSRSMTFICIATWPGTARRATDISSTASKPRSRSCR